MQYFKRYILLSALLAFLIGCFVFSVSAAPLNVDLSLNGVTHSVAYNAGDTWGDLVNEDLWFDDDQGAFEIIDGCIVLRVTARDGSVSRYSLYIYDDNMPVYELVMPYDAFSDTADYRLAPYGTGEITLKLDGVFEKHYFAGNVDLWGDLCDSSLVGDGVPAFIIKEDTIDENGDGVVLFVLDGVYGYYVRDDENQRIRNEFGFSPGVYNLELAFQSETTSTISVDLNGQTCAFFYGSEVDTFAELISSGTYSHPILGTCRWEVCDGYITLVMLDYEEPLYYRLVVSDEQLSWTLVPEGAELISDVPYALSVELIVNVKGSPYSFKLPSYVKTWNDVLLLNGPYEHPELGMCRWFSDNDHVCMEVIDQDGISYYHILTADRTYVYLDYNFLDAQYHMASYVFITSCASHTFGEETVDVVPTCTTDGSGKKICTVCDFVSRYVIPAWGHSYLATGHRAATCEDKGFTKYTCTRCGDTYNEDIPRLHHLWNIEVIQEPTCETIGVSRFVCGSCGLASEPYEVAALGHQAADATVVREPTCTEAGVYSTYCERCGYAWEYDVRQRNHEYDWKGTCQFCGYNKITGAIVDGWNKVQDAAKDFLDGLPGGDGGDDLCGWFSGLGDSIDKFLNTLKIIVFSFIAIIFLPYILKGAAWVFKHLKEAFSDIGDFFGDLSKSVKRKAARRGK